MDENENQSNLSSSSPDVPVEDAVQEQSEDKNEAATAPQQVGQPAQQVETNVETPGGAEVNVSEPAQDDSSEGSDSSES